MISSTLFGKLVRITVSVAMIACFGQVSLADENDRAPANDSTGVEDTEQATEIDEIVEFDEIVVIANRSGNPVDVDAKYEELLRKRIIQDLERLRALREEIEWRSQDAATVDNPRRLRWGYDPRDQSRMRQDSRIADLPIDDTKPATIFSIDF